MGSPVIVIRSARKADEAARVQLVRDALAETYTDAFLYFFFQELTLQMVVLCGAVLFIFVGVPASACVLLLPAAAALVLLCVWLHAATVHNNTTLTVRSECAGWVAELYAPLAPGGGGAAAGAGGVPLIHEQDLTGEQRADMRALHRQIVGTVSLCGDRCEPAAGRVSALCVSRAWRRRGAGRALLGAVTSRARADGLCALHAATSHLQPAARSLLHNHGWECRGTYHRQLLGDTLTLPMAQLALDLPYA